MPVAPAILESLVATCERRSRRPVIVICIDELGDGRFGVQFGANNLSVSHMEAAGLTLLRALRDDVGACPECSACQDRTLRLAAAIAALEARPAAEGAH